MRDAVVKKAEPVEGYASSLLKGMDRDRAARLAKARATLAGASPAAEVAVRAPAVPTESDAEEKTLALLKQGEAAIREAATVEEASEVLARVKIMATATRALKLSEETIRNAETLRVRAERRAGELLEGTRRRGRGRPPKITDVRDLSPKLSDIGVSHDDAARFRDLAALPEQAFETAIEDVRSDGGSVTSGAVLRKADPASAKRRHLQLSFDLEDRLRSALEAGDVDALFAVAREILG